MGKDWKSKLYVVVIDDLGKHLVTPIQDINPTFNTPHTPIHSLEAENVGIFKGVDTFGFTMTVHALRDEETNTNPAKVITDIQLKHKEFMIVMNERKTTISDGNNWAFETILLAKCYVNSGSPTRAVVNGAPVAVFNCMSLEVTVDGESYTGTLAAE